MERCQRRQQPESEIQGNAEAPPTLLQTKFVA
jgi:hypothetical protein